MKKIYHLSTCDTCQRIIRLLGGGAGFTLQDIKTQPITEADLDWLHDRVGSYEALFNKRARKYKELGLKEQPLTEGDFKKWILAEYTFLKRPVVVIGEQVFAGNAPKTVAAAQEALEK